MKGYIHLYYGDGKGKTTAAMGLALRAAGHGRQVVVVQFLKTRPSGEVDALEKLGVQVLRGKGCSKFLAAMNEQERADTIAAQQKLLWRAQEAASGSGCALLILDEAADACNAGLIETVELCRLLAKKPEELEIVLTGHNPPPELLELADYVSHVKKEKHPYDQGVAAREGIEF